MAKGKYESKHKKTPRVYLWLGICLTMAALLFLFMIGAFVVQGIRVRNKGKEDSAKYLQTAPIATETAATTAPVVEKTEETAETTEPVTEPETQPTEPPRFPMVDFAGLQGENPDVVGWLQVPALSIIDYPVVIGEDNSFYTTHDWEKNESENGAVFHSQFPAKEELKEDSETITLSTCVGGATRLAVHGILTERVPYGK